LVKRNGGFRRRVLEQRRIAAGEDDPGIGIFARELDRSRNAFGGFVEAGIVAASGRDFRDHRAAEHDHTVRRAARRIPGRKALFERQHQEIAERRQAGDRDQNYAGDDEPARQPPHRRQQQDDPDQADLDQEIGRHDQDAENF